MSRILEAVAVCKEFLHEQGVSKIEIILQICSRHEGISVDSRMSKMT
jgi:uncharacterized protein YqgV (UPF0045/DUF77 family)